MWNPWTRRGFGLCLGCLLAATCALAGGAQRANFGQSPVRAVRATEFAEPAQAWTGFTFDERSFESKAGNEWSLRPATPNPAVLRSPADPFEVERRQRDWGAHLNEPVRRTNAIGMELVLIPPGEFVRRFEYHPRCFSFNIRVDDPVQICNPFLLGRTEVTQQQWRAVMGSEPWRNDPGNDPDKTPNRDTLPARNISFGQAAEFCNRLSEREGLEPYYRIEAGEIHVAGGRGYFLPSVAEWEYACRAGTEGDYFFGSDASLLEKYGWAQPVEPTPEHNGPTGPAPVATKLPNALGLHDMYGNVAEYCDGRVGYYAWVFDGNVSNPSERERYFRVQRCGGNWQSRPGDCRSFHEHYESMSGSAECDVTATNGLRVARRPLAFMMQRQD